MTIKKQLDLYANLMDEAKARIHCIDIMIAARTGFPPPIVREFCYLQLRFLCELIALACVVAHGDIKALQSHQTAKAYSAEEILERLSKLRPHFYPFACKQTVHDTHMEMTPIDPPPLSKGELLTLYGQTHKHLHRGSLKKLLSSDAPIDMTINLPEIVGWAQKINDLLSIHTIAIDGETLIVCISAQCRRRR
jgi:hypothetical protein